MKKSFIYILLTLCLSFGPFFLYSRKEKVIKVTPFVNEIPEGIPFIPYAGARFAEDLKDSGYRVEWTLMQKQPKKRRYLRRLIYFLKNLNTEKIILNNLNPPFSKAKLKRIPSEKLILIAWEPPSVFEYQYTQEILDLFGTVLTWHDELIDGKKFIKFHYPSIRPLEDNLPSFENRNLLCMINSNLKFNDFEKELYSMRRDAVKFFEDKPIGTFDLYGKGWEGCKNAKGRVPDKQETLKKYKFNFCFENAAVPGYITEKIFDSFATGTIPIYLGAPNIEDYIPKECFIDYRQFNDFEEMLTFIQKMTKEKYESYLSHIRVFLKSPESQKFTQKCFSDTLWNALTSKKERS
ncbi:MAG: glycosyltransferase family 10 [Simkaniaceae bacterium]|nr:glycosyltransferase family 10 [Simkaniaceae bacterium]